MAGASDELASCTGVGVLLAVAVALPLAERGGGGRGAKPVLAVIAGGVSFVGSTVAAAR